MDDALLLLTMGDACGIGPETILKAVADGETRHCLVIGDAAVLGRAARVLGLQGTIFGILDDFPRRRSPEKDTSPLGLRPKRQALGEYRVCRQDERGSSAPTKDLPTVRMMDRKAHAELRNLDFVVVCHNLSQTIFTGFGGIFSVCLEILGSWQEPLNLVLLKLRRRLEEAL
jgi:hypothetical protein